MSEASARGRMGYTRARALLLVAGLFVLALLTLYLYLRQVDPVEKYGTVLFIPVFVCFVFWNVRGGLVAGMLAGIVYMLLRTPQIRTFGTQDFIELVLARSLFYVAFGVVGGWANRQMEQSLSKLEIYDQIDDATGLFNARFFLQDTDLEISRSGRYQTIFSVSSVDIPSDSLDALSRRQRQSVLKDIGRVLRESIRTVDRAVHGESSSHHRIAVVLPETGKEGVQVFTSRLVEKLAAYLTSRGVPLEEGGLGHRALTFPGDDEELSRLRQEFSAIEHSEHPDAKIEETSARDQQ